MKIKEEHEQDYAILRETNTKDFYSAGVIDYLERWADMMEQEIENGSTVGEAAEQTRHIADTQGITGFMYGCAVQILCQYWEHGEQLDEWRNKEYECLGQNDPTSNTADIADNDEDMSPRLGM